MFEYLSDDLWFLDRLVDNLRLFWNVSYSLLGERCSDNISGQIFYGLPIL